MYYEFSPSPLEDFGITKGPTLPRSVSFLTGALISEPLAEPLVFQVNTTTRHPPADYLGIKVPVFANRLVNALRELGIDNLQTFVARLENPETRERWEGYQAVNIVGLVSCLAPPESGATPMLPPLYSLGAGELVIDEAHAAGGLLFRLAEAPEVVLLHRRLGDSLLDASPEFQGLECRDVGSV